jgi:hypothetical protein
MPASYCIFGCCVQFYKEYGIVPYIAERMHAAALHHDLSDALCEQFAECADVAPVTMHRAELLVERADGKRIAV